jgi:hypothetical protein
MLTPSNIGDFKGGRVAATGGTGERRALSELHRLLVNVNQMEVLPG